MFMASVVEIDVYSCIPEPFNHMHSLMTTFLLSIFFKCKSIVSSPWNERTTDEVYFCHIFYLSVLLKFMTGIKPNGPLKKSDSI